MAFLDQHQLATDPAFRMKVEVALVKSAIAVMAESVATDGHAERAAYASKVLAQPALMSGPAAMAVATGFVTEESSDGDIEFTLNSMFNALAGYSAAE